MLGYTDDSHVSDELKAAIYHEIAHIKFGDKNRAIVGAVSPYAGLATGVLAMYMIERYQEKKKEAKLLANTHPDLTPEEKKQWLSTFEQTNNKTTGEKFLEQQNISLEVRLV